jgi:hypothetical protein
LFIAFVFKVTFSSTVSVSIGWFSSEIKNLCKSSSLRKYTEILLGAKKLGGLNYSQLGARTGYVHGAGSLVKRDRKDNEKSVLILHRPQNRFI